MFLCSSGTVAVELALRGLNLQPGDEVILAGYDFRGNFLNVLTVGAIPVLVDIDPQTGQLDPQRVAEAISPKTRAVIASHLHGGVVDMAALRQLADRHGFAILEDACQMPGAPLGDRRAGMHGDVGILSFGGSKLLSAGRGGGVITNRADVAARIRRYTQRGNDAYPLSELQAAVLIPQLDQLDARRTERRLRVEELRHRLADCSGLTFFAPPASTMESDFYKVGLRYHSESFAGLSRDVFCAAMQAEGVALFAGFRALHRLHARSRFRQSGELTQVDQADTDWVVFHHPVLLAGSAALEEIVQAIQKVQLHAEHLVSAKLKIGQPVTPWETDR